MIPARGDTAIAILCFIFYTLLGEAESSCVATWRFRFSFVHKCLGTHRQKASGNARSALREPMQIGH